MGENFDPSRRKFLREIVVAGVAPGVILNAVSGEQVKVAPEEMTLDEIKKYFEELPYPKPEEVPEYLRDYASGFHNWLELVESQRINISDFLDSYFINQSLSAEYTETFPKKTQEEIGLLVQDLLADRKENFNQNEEIIYRKLRYELGKYLQKEHQIILDTLSNVPHPYENEGKGKYDYQTEFIDLFTALHEFWHSATLPKLIPGSVFDKILIFLAENDVITERVKKANMEYCFKTDDGRKDIRVQTLEGNTLNYFQNPTEIYSFLMQIRGNLHFVSKYNPHLVVFDMNKDSFTMEHLEFLKANQDKIFSNINKFENHDGAMMEVTKSIFTKQLDNFTDEQFVILMNIVV